MYIDVGLPATSGDIIASKPNGLKTWIYHESIRKGSIPGAVGRFAVKFDFTGDGEGGGAEQVGYEFLNGKAINATKEEPSVSGGKLAYEVKHDINFDGLTKLENIPETT